MEWTKDSKTQKILRKLVNNLELSHIPNGQVHCYRTTGSKAHAYARIWSFPKIFQEVLSVKPSYIIELISEKYDKLSDDNKTRVLIHELLHIPKNFSGSLLPHKYGNKKIEHEVDRLFKDLKNL